MCRSIINPLCFEIHVSKRPLTHLHEIAVAIVSAVINYSSVSVYATQQSIKHISNKYMGRAAVTQTDEHYNLAAYSVFLPS
jgi:hypothetical protein